MPIPEAPDAERLTRDQLARSAGVDRAFVDELTSRSLLEPDATGHAPTDVYVVRFALLVTQSGIGLDDLEEAKRAGVVTFGDLEVLHPTPVRATGATHAELAAELGIEPRALGRIRLAAGLADRGPEDPVQSDEERILRLIVEFGGAFRDVRVATRIARIVGERTRQIAASELRIYDELVTQPFIEKGVLLDEEASRRSSEVGRGLLDRAEELMVSLYRHHLDAGLLGDWAQSTESLMARHGYAASRPVSPPAIAFVDLSGFTALTEVRGDEIAAALAERLAAVAEATAAAHGARIVKLLGDGVMLHGDDPSRLVEAAVDLVLGLPAEGLPSAHAGIHAGPVIERDGDYFGRTVNIAARIADQAAAGEVLVSESAAQGAASHMRLTQLSARDLRGVREPMVLFRVARR